MGIGSARTCAWVVEKRAHCHGVRINHRAEAIAGVASGACRLNFALAALGGAPGRVGWVGHPRIALNPFTY